MSPEQFASKWTPEKLTALIGHTCNLLDCVQHPELMAVNNYSDETLHTIEQGLIELRDNILNMSE